jgi:predicted adenylyl cyclase CyaB
MAKKVLPFEIETGFRLKNFNALNKVAKRLKELGATFIQEGLECSFIYVTNKGGIKLRLRSHGDNVWFCLKGPRIPNKRYKIRRESASVPLDIKDMDTMRSICLALGFKELYFEKERQHWVFGDMFVELDIIPSSRGLQYRVEIEGTKTDIRKTAKLLNLDWKHATLASFTEIANGKKKKKRAVKVKK